MKTLYLTEGALIAAAYIIFTLPFAQMAFGPIQFRLAEALTALAALTPAAVPGLFLGCLLTNAFFNPSPLGLIDIIFGSLTTLLAAALTWWLQQRLKDSWYKTLVVLLPPIILNALIVGLYLPFLIPGMSQSFAAIAGVQVSILISEAVAVYVIGLPLLLALRKAGLDRLPARLDKHHH